MKLSSETVRSASHGVLGLGDEWTRVANDFVSTTRWGTAWTLVLAHPDHGHWAYDYERPGGDSEVSDQFPGEEVELYQVTPVEVMTVEYRTVK